jgi:prepilin-type N-terminal cleavage/methylation domain-containing protein
MKIQPALSIKRGFTLIELMVAMAITTIIVTVLVSITSMATDVWNRSRAELRASRQAKTMVDTMARDFETLVTRRGNSYEWLSAVRSTDSLGDKVQSTNSSRLIFFAGSTDRYNGDIGISGKDMGGDVSTIAYRLLYKDPIDNSGSIYKTFVFNRLLINPNDTFKDLLGKDNLTTAFGAGSYLSDLEKANNFVCENVYQFTITFMMEGSKAGVAVTEPVSLKSPATYLKIKGSGIDTDAQPKSLTTDELKAARVGAIEISITVLSDAAIDQIRRPSFNNTQIPTMLAKHGFNYSKRIQVPGN